MSDETFDWVQVGSQAMVVRDEESLDGVAEYLGLVQVKLVVRNGSGALTEAQTDERNGNYVNSDGKLARKYGINNVRLIDPSTDEAVRAAERYRLWKLLLDAAHIIQTTAVTTINVDGPGAALEGWDQAVEAMEKIREFQTTCKVAWRVPGYPMMADLRKKK